MTQRHDSFASLFGAAPRDAQDRARIADVAARLIAEHGIADWSLAKRKAARQLLLPDGAALPADGEIEAALVTHHALFGGDAHTVTLRDQRRQALSWLRELAEFSPTLVGGVAAGWATEHSDIRIDLVADDSKEVELTLINRNVEYRVSPVDARQRMIELFIDTRKAGIRLSIRTPAVARQRPKRDRRGAEDARLDADALAALLHTDDAG
ncbi:MAG: hypothetical protein ABI533_07605 [Betaproteobacteria bacterium]